mmetsp:Transcript_11974/g.26060  ORF Transcript_11974/g.26060 Transcript_11974/m.26060 type:complete len:446 (-) Transcript_11974:849-2186(-)
MIQIGRVPCSQKVAAGPWLPPQQQQQQQRQPVQPPYPPNPTGPRYSRRQRPPSARGNRSDDRNEGASHIEGSYDGTHRKENLPRWARDGDAETGGPRFYTRQHRPISAKALKHKRVPDENTDGPTIYEDREPSVDDCKSERDASISARSSLAKVSFDAGACLIHSEDHPECRPVSGGAGGIYYTGHYMAGDPTSADRGAPHHTGGGGGGEAVTPVAVANDAATHPDAHQIHGERKTSAPTATHSTGCINSDDRSSCNINNKHIGNACDDHSNPNCGSSATLDDQELGPVMKVESENTEGMQAGSGERGAPPHPPAGNNMNNVNATSLNSQSGSTYAGTLGTLELSLSEPRCSTPPTRYRSTSASHCWDFDLLDEQQAPVGAAAATITATTTAAAKAHDEHRATPISEGGGAGHGKGPGRGVGYAAPVQQQHHPHPQAHPHGFGIC